MDNKQFLLKVKQFGEFRCERSLRERKVRNPQNKGPKGVLNTCQGDPHHSCKFELSKIGRSVLHKSHLDGRKRVFVNKWTVSR